MTTDEETIPIRVFQGSPPRDYTKTIVDGASTVFFGNRDLEALLIPNHSSSGPAYIDHRTRILFRGNEAFGGVVIVNITVANLRQTCVSRRLAPVSSTSWRGPGISDASVMERYAGAAEAVLSGKKGTLLPANLSPPFSVTTTYAVG